MSPLDTARFRTTLLEERQRIVAAIEYLHAEHPGTIDDQVEEISATNDNHLAETATVTLDREIDYTLEANSGQVLTEIDAALKRMEEGAYGTCVRCGCEIGEMRLEARPWATLCIECKRREERA
ncbi:MAG TPA: TraR/DksA C4-type zinc finger protein [Gaiellaceae bacterium]|jgi:DnaK suppressor protein